MRFGVGLQTHIENSPKHAVLAEQMGLDSAWFVDSQLIASDVYACMALAADRTRRIVLGTGVTVAETRIPPVIAHSIATINQLAPGRVVLGVGAGHTAWRTMGMPPVPIARFRAAVDVIKGLLRGERVAYSARGVDGEARFLDTTSGYINVTDPVPVYLAASHPRAQALAGEIGDGVILISVQDPGMLEKNLARVAPGWDRRGGRPSDFAAVSFGVTCVLRPGEDLESPRVVARVGPRIAVALHYAHEQALKGRDIPEFMAAFLTPEYRSYLDSRWGEIHETHSRFLQPGEDAFITPAAIRAMSITGTRDEIIERIGSLEAAGLTDLVICPPWGYVEEAIVEFGREIVPALRGSGGDARE